MPMDVPEPILAVWHQFDGFPMETLTKAWWSRQPGGARQRSVAEMTTHRRESGTAGNCFDLAIWFLDTCEQRELEAYAVGHGLLTPEAHVAVVVNVGRDRYLCDLGDQWLLPARIPRPGSRVEGLSPVFPGAVLDMETRADETLRVTYHRPSGKVSTQDYGLGRITEAALWDAAHASQRLLRHPLCEMRIPWGSGMAHWEFSGGRSVISTDTGLDEEPPCPTPDAWCERLHRRTGISASVVATALDVYGGK